MIRPWCVALTAGLLCACSPTDEPGGSARAEPAPNIVLILADDLGYGDVGVYSPDSKIPTPRIDQLAHEGVRLLDAHSPSSICSPSRYGVLTGREPWRESHVQHSLRPLTPPVLEEAITTLPELLARAGYTTAMVGKWHLGRRYTLRPNQYSHERHNIDWSQPLVDGPLQHGFDRFFGLARPGWTFMLDDMALAPPSEEFDLGDVPEAIYGRHAHEGVRAPGFRFEQVLPRYTAWTVEFIEHAASRDEPFFLEFAPAVPHTPIAPSSAFRGSTTVGAYGDIVHQLDDSVGQILDALERAGVADDTLVVFTSDNGPETHAYDRLQRHDHASMGPLRGAKHSMFEGGHRVPFIARWPGHIPADTTSNETISLVDLMATLASAARIALPADTAVDSHDMMPALLSQHDGAPIRQATLHSRSRHVSIRSGAWVFLENGGRGRPEPLWFLEQRNIEARGRGGPALFDLEDDLAQTQNLAAQHPDRVEAMRALRERLTASNRTAIRGAEVPPAAPTR